MKQTLLALSVLLSVSALGQNVLGTSYQIRVLGPGWQDMVPSIGLDDHGRAAGCAEIWDQGPPHLRAWTFVAGVGYLLAEGNPSTVGGVSPDGTIVGSCFGSPTIFDWAGNQTLVFAEVAGSFMAVNRNRLCAGYVFDMNADMRQTAVLYGPDGTWTVLGDDTMAGSAAYGVNDNSQAVGYATDDSGVHAFLWNGAMSYLPTPEGYGAVAAGLNNKGTIVGWALSPVDDILPVAWNNKPGVTYSMMLLPDGYTHGVASAVNDNGVAVGSMWAPGLMEHHAFVYTENSGVVDLNDLKTANARFITLVSAGAVNRRGQIAGIARIHDGYVAYLATPKAPLIGPSPIRK